MNEPQSAMSTTVNVPRIVVAGVTSGVGKTTVSVGLMGALARRGLRVQPFKVGPDYVDPTYHQAAVGVPSRSLDSWMLPEDAVLRLFGRAVRNADIAVIEGVMGLYDGRYGERNIGTTAHVARLLGAPVILVVDVAKVAQSAAATVLGYRAYDPSIHLAGVILNNIGSQRHLKMVEQAIAESSGAPVLGGLPKSEDLVLPERHLGLVPTQEGLVPKNVIQSVVDFVSSNCDVDAILGIAQTAGPLDVPQGPESVRPAVGRKVRLAVAMDEAFTFYYPDNLDLLSDLGAEIAPFSPIKDPCLPADVHGIYMGGGFPELYSQQLSSNERMKESIKKAAASGMPVYGECGGLMYLSEGITDFDGRRFEMLGLAPGWCVMQKKRVNLGYLTVEARHDNVLMRAGARVRGHEFHWSSMEGGATGPDVAYRVVDDPPRIEGYARGNILASYLHLHFAADPSLAANLLNRCFAWSEAVRMEVQCNSESLENRSVAADRRCLRRSKAPPGPFSRLTTGFRGPQGTGQARLIP